MPSPESKQVKFRGSDHAVLEQIQTRVMTERGLSNLSIPQMVMEAVKFWDENRPKA